MCNYKLFLSTLIVLLLNKTSFASHPGSPLGSATQALDTGYIEQYQKFELKFSTVVVNRVRESLADELWPLPLPRVVHLTKWVLMHLGKHVANNNLVRVFRALNKPFIYANNYKSPDPRELDLFESLSTMLENRVNPQEWNDFQSIPAQALSLLTNLMIFNNAENDFMDATYKLVLLIVKRQIEEEERNPQLLCPTPSPRASYHHFSPANRRRTRSNISCTAGEIVGEILLGGDVHCCEDPSFMLLHSPRIGPPTHHSFDPAISSPIRRQGSLDQSGGHSPVQRRYFGIELPLLLPAAPTAVHAQRLPGVNSLTLRVGSVG